MIKTRECKEAIEAPSKRWRNKWFCHEPGWHETHGDDEWLDGEYLSDGVFPSKDVAEQVALETIARCHADGILDCCEYLGAIPSHD